MLQKIKSIWNLLSSFGVHSLISDSEVKRIKLTNQLCLFSFVFYLVFDTVFLLFDIPVFQFDYYLTGLIFPIVLYLNYKGKTTAAKLMLYFIFNFGVLNLHFFYGKSFETNLLLFPVMQIPFFLFSRKQSNYLLITIMFPFLAFIYVNLSGISNPANLDINADHVVVMKNTVHLTVALAFFVVIFLYTRLNQKSEQFLVSKNSILEEQLRIIFDNSTDALLVIDTDTNLISNVNTHAVELLQGNKSEDIVGRQLPDFHKEKLNPEQIAEIRKNLKINKFWSGEVEFETLKGNYFWGDLAVKRLETSNTPFQLVRIANITLRKVHEQHMESSLMEKQVLIDEIHHRVKNNLAIISSLLHLQSSQIEDKKLLEIFDESRRRIHSMALIHEKLYHNESLEKIDFAEYVKALVDSIKASYNASAVLVSVKTSITNVFLELKYAIPFALILNELISNSYKHAFKDRDNGSISILITKNDSLLSMQIEDDGVGFHGDVAASTTLGLSLVASLVDQIDGKLITEVKNGTSFQLTVQTLPV
jgi:PAS domain S-box-containing protein